MSPKTFLREVLLGSPILNPGRPTLSAGFGRAGSSLFAESCVVCLAKERILPATVKTLFGADHIPAWDLENIRRVSWVYKTHAHFRSSLPTYVQTLYTFDDIPMVLASHRRMLREGSPEWRRSHLNHFNVRALSSLDPLAIFREFDIKGNFESWFEQTTHPVAFARMDALWKCQTEISDFLGYDFQPTEAQRGRASGPEILEGDEQYREFTKFVQALPNFFIKNQRAQRC